MPSTDLSGFGKAMFEKRMRERNMGQDPFGQFRMPTQEGPQPPTVIFPERPSLPPMIPPTKIGDGFDNSALMQDPKFKQEDTMNQGMAVSEPYEEANEKAFEKNNPMNAISQETPVGDKVSAFLKLMGR